MIESRGKVVPGRRTKTEGAGGGVTEKRRRYTAEKRRTCTRGRIDKEVLSEKRRIERKVTRRSTERMEKIERKMKNGREVR